MFKVWVCTASPANNPESDYKAWGHSSIVSPWGEVVATTEGKKRIKHREIKDNKRRKGTREK